MKVTCLHDLTLADLALARSGEDRTPGLHLSDIIKAIMKKIDPKTYDNDTPMDPNVIEPGFAFEVALERAFNVRRMDILRIGEVEKDGVIMSPDGVDFGDPPTLEEFKFTKKSAKDTPWPCGMHAQPREDCNYCTTEFGPKFYVYLLQIKAYCYALGLRHARLRVMFVNGNYSSGANFTPPEFRNWAFEFTEEELAKHWAYMLREAEIAGLRQKEAA